MLSRDKTIPKYYQVLIINPISVIDSQFMISEYILRSDVFYLTR